LGIKGIGFGQCGLGEDGHPGLIGYPQRKAQPGRTTADDQDIEAGGVAWKIVLR
jgi:hypothetical protein